MPARVSRIGFSRRRVLGLAYSERYIAAPRPSGVAISIAITDDLERADEERGDVELAAVAGDQPSLHSAASSTLERNAIA